MDGYLPFSPLELSSMTDFCPTYGVLSRVFWRPSGSTSCGGALSVRTLLLVSDRAPCRLGGTCLGDIGLSWYRLRDSCCEYSHESARPFFMQGEHGVLESQRFFRVLQAMQARTDRRRSSGLTFGLGIRETVPEYSGQGSMQQGQQGPRRWAPLFLGPRSRIWGCRCLRRLIRFVQTYYANNR